MALVNAAGTLLAKSPGGTVLETVAEADPKVKVLVNVYRKSPYDKVNYPEQMLQLAFRAGQIISLNARNAEFAVPTITSVSPATGAAAGGTTVTISGTNFTTGATVGFGGTAGTSVTVVSSKLLTVVTPAKTAGAYDVTVVTAAGTATAEDAYTYA